MNKVLFETRIVQKTFLRYKLRQINVLASKSFRRDRACKENKNKNFSSAEGTNNLFVNVNRVLDIFNIVKIDF